MKKIFDFGHAFLLEKDSAWYVHGLFEYKEKRRHYSKNIEWNQMVYRLGGKSTVTIGNDIFDVHSDMIFITRKGHYDNHYFDTEITGDSIDIFFDTDIELPASVTVFDAKSNPRLRELFLKLYKTWELQKGGYYSKCMSIFYDIIYEIGTLHTEYLPISRIEQIAPAIDYLRDHCFEPNFSCEELAEKCGMSYTYFKRIFNMTYKMPPIKYLTSLRMAKAQDLLNETKMNCTEIAEAVGYQSGYYFTRVFKKYFGHTPTFYRGK